MNDLNQGAALATMKFAIGQPVPRNEAPTLLTGAGCAGSLPAVMNAVVDALADRGVTHLDMPATPLRLWQAIHNSTRNQAA